jgi:hypothetical protein
VARCKADGCGLFASYGVTSRVACKHHKSDKMRILTGARCPHGKRKNTCGECGGASVCRHGRQKHQCGECGGTSVCQHGRQRHQCGKCGKPVTCAHNRRRNQCKECDGVSFCEHGKPKARCLQCGGSQLCQCGNRKNARYDGWCADCHHRLFPEHPLSLNRNDGEYRLAQHLDQHPQVASWSKHGIDCGGRTLIPDAIVEIEGGGTVMIELDGVSRYNLAFICAPKAPN